MYTNEELEATGLTDFRVFLRQCFDFLGLPAPTPVQNDIARELQNGGDKLVIEAFRGVGKSWITVCFVCWCFLINPQVKIMVVSASAGLAYDFSKFVRQLIGGMSILEHLAPRVGQLDSMEKMDVGPATPSKDPSLKSVGITGQLTGSRADFIIADDVEVPKNSYTHLLREKIFKLVSEFRDVAKPQARIIYLGTPQVEDSLYSKLAKIGFRVVVWPAEIPSKIAQYSGRLGRLIQRMIDGGATAKTPVEPTRFPDVELMLRRMEKGQSGYSLQYLLDTTLSDVDKKPLKCRDFLIMDVDRDQGFIKVVWGMDRDNLIQMACGGLDGDYYVKPTWLAPEMQKWQGTVMAIDPSGRGKDETGVAIVRYLFGQLYLVKVAGFTDGFGEPTIAEIAKCIIEFGVTEVIDEENYGGGMFRQLLKPAVIKAAQEYIDPLTGKIGAAVPKFMSDDPDWKGSWSSTQKEFRICDTLEPILAGHRLVVDRRVIEEDLLVQENASRYSFIQQLTRMERVKGVLPNEDRLEAVSMACGYWTERMDRDRDKMEQKYKDNLITNQLKDFVRHISGLAGRKGKVLIGTGSHSKPRFAGRR